MKFYVSLVATDATTANGQPLERGGEVDLSPDERADRHNARLIAEGQLISVSNAEKAVTDAEDALKRPPEPVAAGADVPPASTTQEGGADQ